MLGGYAGIADDGSGDNYGFDWRWGGSAGQAIFAESGVLYGNAGGVMKVGGYFHSGELENFATGGTSHWLGAIYAIIDHPFEGGVNAFLRGSTVLEEESAVATSTIDSGITASNVFREGATLGLGVSHTLFGNDYLRATPGVTATETIVELTYQLPLNDHFVIQPDLQYIFNPPESGSDALVLGLRASIAF